MKEKSKIEIKIKAIKEEKSIQTSEEINQWEDYRNSILELKSKSDDDFERLITYITSGSLGISLSFIDKVVPLTDAMVKYFIIIGWFSLALSLFLNLYSHYKSSRNIDKIVQDIDNNIGYNKVFERVGIRNVIIIKLNKTSLFLLGIGIFCILLFVSINILMKKM